MHRAGVLALLRRHARTELEPLEAEMTADTIRFVESNADCLLRSQLEGHLTGSAWIIDATGTKTLLTHHLKLNKWVQLGGHADGDSDLWQVAQREAHEESGLRQWEVRSKEIFDLDRHLIPGRNRVPEHYHYDLRFVFEADPREPLIVSAESKELAWVSLDQVAVINPEESMARMVKKSRLLAD